MSSAVERSIISKSGRFKIKYLWLILVLRYASINSGPFSYLPSPILIINIITPVSCELIH